MITTQLILDCINTMDPSPELAEPREEPSSDPTEGATVNAESNTNDRMLPGQATLQAQEDNDVPTLKPLSPNDESDDEAEDDDTKSEAEEVPPPAK
jgi:hypothetical protein